MPRGYAGLSQRASLKGPSTRSQPSPGEAWKQENLERLRRSLRKEQGRRHPFHWDEARWDDLLKGYAGEA